MKGGKWDLTLICDLARKRIEMGFAYSSHSGFPVSVTVLESNPHPVYHDTAFFVYTKNGSPRGTRRGIGLKCPRVVKYGQMKDEHGSSPCAHILPTVMIFILNIKYKKCIICPYA